MNTGGGGGDASSRVTADEMRGRCSECVVVVAAAGGSGFCVGATLDED